MAVSSTILHSDVNAGDDVKIRDDPFKVLRERAALDHDAAERRSHDPPRYHPQAREAIQNQIDLWARDRSTYAKPVVWLTGAAGAGKSAIAQTLIERWKNEELIVPNFFCWRAHREQNHKTCIIPTLAFQLTEDLPGARSKIAGALEDWRIFDRNLKSQVEELIVGPVEDILANGQLIVIVIDGLDEICVDLPPDREFPGQDHEEQQLEMLEVMTFACQKLPSLRVFIASRPERQICTAFAKQPLAALSLQVSLDQDVNADKTLSLEEVNADITLYLKCKFAEIRQRHPEIDSSWPSDRQISVLVERSSGQFIYPSTAVKYISRGRGSPVEILNDVLSLQSKSSNHGKPHPLAELDSLYTLVLQTVAPESWDIARLVLGLACYHDIAKKLPYFSCMGTQAALTPQYLEHFLFLFDGELSTHLADLHSLLSIPDSSRPSRSLEIRSLHATLSDYLCTQSRSGDLSIKKGDIFSQCSVFLVKHTQLLGSNGYPVYNKLVNIIVHCSISADLMTTLWDFLKAHLGEYSSPDVVPPELKSQTGTHWFVFGNRDPKFVQHQKQEKYIIDYLSACNIPQFEPSQSHREVIDKRLQTFLHRHYPEHVRSANGIVTEILVATHKPEKRGRFRFVRRLSGWLPRGG